MSGYNSARIQNNLTGIGFWNKSKLLGAMFGVMNNLSGQVSGIIVNNWGQFSE